MSSAAAVNLRRMQESDLAEVMQVELRAYPWPWSVGNFRDCLHSGYSMWVLETDRCIIGYAVLSVQADEAHLLNICIDSAWQSRGLGRRLLRDVRHAAQAQGAQRIFLEVRFSNTHAVCLYQDEGFNEIGRRPRYYPAANHGREDGLVMAMELLD